MTNLFQRRRFAIHWEYAPGPLPADEGDLNMADGEMRTGNDRLSAALDLTWIVLCNEADAMSTGALPSEL